MPPRPANRAVPLSRRDRTRKPAPVASHPVVTSGAPRGIALTVAWWALAAALVGSGVLVDPSAQAAFDAPQRLAAVLGAGIAAMALLWADASRPAAPWSNAARAIAALAACLGVWLCVATVAASDAAVSQQALRTIALFALLLPLGASALLDGRHGARLAWVVAGVVALNAILSLLQAAGLSLPLAIARLGGRLPTAALLGNEGYVALACALFGAAAVAVAANARSARLRTGALVALLACIAAIAVNRQATAAIALLAACGLVVALRLRRRWLVGAGAGVVALAALTAGVAPLRAVTWAAAADLATYQQASTYRISAWTSALAMAERHPLLGVGPGGFENNAQRYRFDAEIALRERLPLPPTANAFAHAHNDALQLAAEAGWPALLLALAAFGWLLARLLALARSPGAVEPLLLAAVLAAGAVAALAWFPLQVPLTAAMLLLAAGRAWRLVASDTAADA